MYEVFEHLLQSYGISAYKFCKDTGISQSTISTWKKKNNLISGELAKKIADYFNVSIEYLMTGEEKDRGDKYYLNNDTAEIAQAVFENKDLRVLFDAAKDASPEDLKTTYDMLMALNFPSGITGGDQCLTNPQCCNSGLLKAYTAFSRMLC